MNIFHIHEVPDEEVCDGDDDDTNPPEPENQEVVHVEQVVRQHADVAPLLYLSTATWRKNMMVIMMMMIMIMMMMMMMMMMMKKKT